MAEATILFADNDHDFLNTRAEFLEQAGYRVLKALNVQEARRLLEEARVHLAILDIRMENDDDERDTSGLALAKDLDYRCVPKIILTGFPTYQAVREALGPVLDGLPPAVDFLDKREGPEALIQAMERAFAQSVRINWGLNVRWGHREELQPPHLVSLISPDVPMEWLADRAGELEDLLRKLFYEYGQVTLGRILARRTGWIVLSAFAYPPQGPEEQFVVACGHGINLQTEEACYRSFVPSKAGDRTVSLTKSAETVHFGAIAYQLGRRVVEEVTPFAEFYHQHAADAVAAVVDDLFQVALHSWYEKEREERGQPVEALCQDWLGPDERELPQAELGERIAGICRAALAAGVMGLSCSPHKLVFRTPDGTEHAYLNPAPYLHEERVATSPPTLCGITHGRLDGESVLVDGTGQTWVLDFGNSGPGPLLRDFASLETAVKFDVLQGVGLAERHELERRLLDMQHLAGKVDAEGASPEVEKGLRVVGQIRSQAAGVVGPEIEPYLVGLLFCAAKCFLCHRPELRYTKGEMVVFTHALLSAGMLCRRLVAWEDRLEDLPTQAANSLWIDVDNQEVWVEGRRVTLTPQGFRLLKYLYDRANQLCTRAAIAEHVFDLDSSDVHPTELKLMERDQINTNLSRLRRAVEPNPGHPKYILTVRGSGYKLVLSNVPSDGDN